MMKWDSRMHNTRSVQVLKVAIPFFDVSEGELCDVFFSDAAYDGFVSHDA